MASVVLGYDVETNDDIEIDDAARRQGLYIVGAPGTGKSTLLLNLIIQDICLGQGVCLLDPHGDLVDSLLEALPSCYAENIILLDVANTDYPFGLNIFQCDDLTNQNLVTRIATEAVQIFERAWGESSWGPRVAQIMRNTAYTLIANQGYTMADIPLLLLDNNFRESLVKNVRNPQVVTFWKTQYAIWSKNPKELMEHVESTLNKVDEFLTQPTVLHIVGQSRSTIDFRAVMDQKKALFIKLALGQVGEEIVSLLGSTLVAQIFNAALTRQDTPPHGRTQFNLYCDEYQRFSTPVFATLLAEARKYALATTIAHQFRDQLDKQSRSASVEAANMIVFRVSGQDARELAVEFDAKPPAPEVTGQKPIQVVSPDPLSHLLRNGHPNPEVTKIVQDNLRSIYDLSESLGHDRVHALTMPYTDIPRVTYRISPESLKDGLRLLNLYLVESCIDNDSTLRTKLLTSAVITIRGHLTFAPQWYQPPRNVIHDMGIDDPFPEDSIQTLEEYVWRHLFHEYGPEAVANTEKLKQLRIDYWQSSYTNHLKSKPSPEQFDSLAQSEINHLLAFIYPMGRLASMLLAEPVMENSGRFESIFDRPLSTDEVRNQIANRLANQPLYEARCKILQGRDAFETSIQTCEAPGPEADNVMALVSSSTQYVRRFEQVREEIEKRQQREDLPQIGRFG